ncbi:hypothetical protein L596_014475 [Steinernema carpocapsae]|uniref:Apple domain-containing protein n=1 Tax=Steinernema carpocapsae TaxID=34508 RepID=A0A4V6A2S3_STECR|nr:hypothetical protein L596_014475 [Steinernema carpocapsae]
MLLTMILPRRLSLPLYLLLFALLLRSSEAQTTVEDDCLQYYLNIKMTCVMPVERRSGVSLAECKTLCLVNLDRCRSFQYDTIQRQCNVFSVKNPLLAPLPKPSGFSPTQAFPLKDQPSLNVKKLRSVRSVTGTPHISEIPVAPEGVMGGALLSNDYCEPTMIPSIGVTFMSPTLSCQRRQVEAAPPRLFGPPPNPFGAPVSAVQPRINFDNLPECPDASRPLVQLIDGVEVPARSPIEVTSLPTPDQCLVACQTKERSNAPCQSATFDRSSGRCTLFDDSINPNGDLQYTPNVNVIYFEKMCVSEVHSLIRCDDAAHRIPQHILVGHAAEIATTANQIECIKLCIVAQVKFGFECRSLLYFFEFPVENCILNKQTRISKPDFFIAERRQKVDYVQLPTCWTSPAWQREDVKSPKNSKPSLLANSDWSKWSRCDVNAHLQSRSRNCSGCVGGNREVTPCVPEKQFEKEFGNLVAEQEISESGQRFIDQDGFNSLRESSKPLKLLPVQKEERFAPQAREDDQGGLKRKIISSFECDPIIECCPVIDEETLRPDCSRGYHIGPDLKEESCFPEHCSWNPATQQLQAE